ncbi:hypothetical protein M0R45_002760 [Rubus argutus]|uniref:Uncharacterized protein n=1 Tax=Rubus argutus TaxID=59490 RepID=A0AAW1VQF8_RUBAR
MTNMSSKFPLESSILMHEDNQFGRCGRTLLWISDHILHRALLSLPSPSSGYGRRRRRNREESISNNRFITGQLMMFISIYMRLCI